jgi:hypothetical protein
MAVREVDRRAPARERRPCRDDRQFPHPERLESRSDEEAEPIRDDLDRDPRRLGTPDEREKPGSCGCAAAVARSAAGSTSIIDISSSINRREPIRPAS